MSSPSPNTTHPCEPPQQYHQQPAPLFRPLDTACLCFARSVVPSTPRFMVRSISTSSSAAPLTDIPLLQLLLLPGVTAAVRVAVSEDRPVDPQVPQIS